jgi:hypothetical protein
MNLAQKKSNRPSSLRKQGPITTGFRGYERPLPAYPNESTRRMGPRFRGDDVLRLVARQNKLSWPGAFLHLAPLARRGRRRRGAASPGEGDSPRVLPCRESPSPQPSKSELRSSRPRKRGEGARRASDSTVIARLDRATQYAAASHSSFRGARATRTRNLEEQVHSTSRFRIGPHCGPSGMTEKHRC